MWLLIGLLTIGPRFGGAIDDAARYFKDAYDKVRLMIYEHSLITHQSRSSSCWFLLSPDE